MVRMSGLGSIRSKFVCYKKKARSNPKKLFSYRNLSRVPLYNNQREYHYFKMVDSHMLIIQSYYTQICGDKKVLAGECDRLENG